MVSSKSFLFDLLLQNVVCIKLKSFADFCHVCYENIFEIIKSFNAHTLVVLWFNTSIFREKKQDFSETFSEFSLNLHFLTLQLLNYCGYLDEVTISLEIAIYHWLFIIQFPIISPSSQALNDVVFVKKQLTKLISI